METHEPVLLLDSVSAWALLARAEAVRESRWARLPVHRLSQGAVSLPPTSLVTTLAKSTPSKPLLLAQLRQLRTSVSTWLSLFG